MGNHALVDGNKRLGWIGSLLFLSHNGVELRVDTEADTALVLSIADGSRTDVADVGAELVARIIPTSRTDPVSVRRSRCRPW